MKICWLVKVEYVKQDMTHVKVRDNTGLQK